jgi:hypothetical protein
VIHHSFIGRNPVGKVLYGLLDDAYITAQCFTIGHNNARHLTGTPAVGQATVSAGVSMLTLFAPFGSIGKTNKILNAAQFNSIWKGSINSASKVGTQSLIRHNIGVREMEAFRKFYTPYNYSSAVVPYVMEPDSIR